MINHRILCAKHILQLISTTRGLWTLMLCFAKAVGMITENITQMLYHMTLGTNTENDYKTA